MNGSDSPTAFHNSTNFHGSEGVHLPGSICLSRSRNFLSCLLTFVNPPHLSCNLLTSSVDSDPISHSSTTLHSPNPTELRPRPSHRWIETLTMDPSHPQTTPSCNRH